MSRHLFIAQPRRVLRLMLAAAALGCGTLAAADDNVVRVEEDWELLLEEPDGDSCAPQVVCAFSPVGHLDGVYAALELNHQSLPDFATGGLTLQVFSGEESLGSFRAGRFESLHHGGETVSWTQRMRLEDGDLHFEVVNGDSQSWGQFGDDDGLSASFTTSLDSLNEYSSDLSAGNSGVNYAANRVARLTLRRVRLYSDEGLISENSLNRVVFPTNDGGGEWSEGQ